jgi:hypothetical protein
MAKCVRKKVVIRKKGSRKVVAEFMAHRGTNCPKPHRKTGHLREYKQMFKTEVKACKTRARSRGKWSRSAFNHCIKQGMKTAIHGR